MSDLREWHEVGRTHHRGGKFPGGYHFTSLSMTTATVRRCQDEWLTVMIYSQTGDERLIIKLAHKASFAIGDQIQVLVSMVTSLARGCVNGHAHIEAVESAPGVWSRNVR